MLTHRNKNKSTQSSLRFKVRRGGAYLSQTFLSGPHRRVNDLQEKLTGPGVEDENGSIDGLRGQVALKGLSR